MGLEYKGESQHWHPGKSYKTANNNESNNPTAGCSNNNNTNHQLYRSREPINDLDQQSHCRKDQPQGIVAAIDKIKKFQWKAGDVAVMLQDANQIKVKIAMLQKGGARAQVLILGNDINVSVDRLYPKHHFYNDHEGTSNKDVAWKERDRCLVIVQGRWNKGWIQTIDSCSRSAAVAIDGYRCETRSYHLENLFQPHILDPAFQRYASEFATKQAAEAGAWTDVPCSEPERVDGGRRGKQRRNKELYKFKISTSFKEPVEQSDGKIRIYHREVNVSIMEKDVKKVIVFFGENFAPNILSLPEFNQRELNVFDTVLSLPFGNSTCDNSAASGCPCAGKKMEYKNALCDCFKMIGCEPNFNMMMEPVCCGIDISKQTMLLAFVVAAVVKKNNGDEKAAGEFLQKAYYYKKMATSLCSDRKTGTEQVATEGKTVVGISKDCVSLHYLHNMDTLSVRVVEDSAVIPSQKMQLRYIHREKGSKEPQPPSQQQQTTGEFVLTKALLLDAYAKNRSNDLNGLVREYCSDY